MIHLVTSSIENQRHTAAITINTQLPRTLAHQENHDHWAHTTKVSAGNYESTPIYNKIMLTAS